MTTYDDQPIPTVELHDDKTVTIAVTFRWSDEWAMDKCEVGPIVGDLRRLIVDSYKDREQLAALVSVLTWDSHEEQLIGHFSDLPWSDRPLNRPINLRTGELEYTDRDLELQDAWRRLVQAVRTASRQAASGSTKKRTKKEERWSQELLADSGKVIQETLAVIHPAHPENSAEWTAIDRKFSLDQAIQRAFATQHWTADSLNAACTAAMATARQPAIT